MNDQTFEDVARLQFGEEENTALHVSGAKRKLEAENLLTLDPKTTTTTTDMLSHAQTALFLLSASHHLCREKRRIENVVAVAAAEEYHPVCSPRSRARKPVEKHKLHF